MAALAAGPCRRGLGRLGLRRRVGRVRRALRAAPESPSSGRRATSSGCSATRSRAKQLAEQVGVPVVPWSGGPVHDAQSAAVAADLLGYPVLVKAAAGGGGRGIRLVESAGRHGRGLHVRSGGGAARVRRPDPLRRAQAHGGAPRGSPGDRRRLRHGLGRRHTRLQHPAAQPEGHRGVRMHAARRGGRADTARRGRAAVRRRGLPRRRHGRVPARPGDEAVHVHRGQHPAAGRAPGHGDDHRARPGQAAAARRARQAAHRGRRRQPAAMRSRHGSTPRTRSTPSLRHRAGCPRCGCRQALASGSTPA